MNVLIVEPEINGHHISMYVRFLVRGLSKKNIKFSILTSKKIIKHPVLSILKKEKRKINFYYLEELIYPGKKNLISLFLFQVSNYFKIKKGFNKILEDQKFDHIFLMTLDHIDKVIPIFGSPFGKNDFSSIHLNPKNHFEDLKIKSLGIKKDIYNFMSYKTLKLRTLKNIYSNDILYVKYIKNKFTKLKSKIHHFDEPVEMSHFLRKDIARKKFHLNKKDFIILVYGAIKDSKAITDIVDLLEEKKLRNNIRFFICGEQTKNISNFLKLMKCKKLIRQRKIIVVNKFINLNEENTVFRVSDLTWLIYKNSSLGSSGVLYLSSKARIPIITSKNGIPHLLNQKFKLGPSVNLTDKTKISKVLNDLSLKNTNYKHYKSKITKFGQKNFVENFYLKILNKLNDLR